MNPKYQFKYDSYFSTIPSINSTQLPRIFDFQFSILHLFFEILHLPDSVDLFQAQWCTAATVPKTLPASNSMTVTCEYLHACTTILKRYRFCFPIRCAHCVIHVEFGTDYLCFLFLECIVKIDCIY